MTVNRHNHPGGAYGYRIVDEDGKVLVICTDVEHGETLDESVIELARGGTVKVDRPSTCRPKSGNSESSPQPFQGGVQ